MALKKTALGKMVVTPISLRKAQRKSLWQIANRGGVSGAEIIRQALDEYIERARVEAKASARAAVTQ